MWSQDLASVGLSVYVEAHASYSAGVLFYKPINQIPMTTKIISWVFSALFFITGLALFAKSPFAGISAFALAIVIFPKTKEFIHKKFHFNASWKIKTGAIVVLLIAMLSTAPKSEVIPSVANQQSDSQSVAEQTVSPTPAEEVAATQPDTASVPQTQTSNTQNNNPATQTQPDLVKVVSVTDGDTIKVSIGGVTQTIRMIGMDTPETVDPRKPVQCFGKEASNKTKEMLSGKMIRLESDSTQGDLDKYQRLLRYVFLEDGTNFGKYMIEQGYAHEYTYDLPYKYQAEYKAAQKDAQANQRGLWSPNTCNGTTTSTSVTTQPNPTPTPTPQPTQSASAYYTSSFHTAKYYYPAACPEWQTLSPDYLKKFDSLEALLKAYPSRTLSPQCQ